MIDLQSYITEGIELQYGFCFILFNFQLQNIKTEIFNNLSENNNDNLVYTYGTATVNDITLEACMITAITWSM